jgi:hypothetical protein
VDVRGARASGGGANMLDGRLEAAALGAWSRDDVRGTRTSGGGANMLDGSAVAPLRAAGAPGPGDPRSSSGASREMSISGGAPHRSHTPGTPAETASRLAG